MLSNMKNQFAGLLKDVGFISASNPKNDAANYNSGTYGFVHVLYLK